MTYERTLVSASFIIEFVSLCLIIWLELTERKRVNILVIFSSFLLASLVLMIVYGLTLYENAHAKRDLQLRIMQVMHGASLTSEGIFSRVRGTLPSKNSIGDDQLADALYCLVDRHKLEKRIASWQTVNGEEHSTAVYGTVMDSH